MAPFVLKFKGNKSFSPFSNLADSESLTRTWRVCTKVASHLEQGQRLENLAWRLFFIHNVMVESDNAKSKREFKKLSKSTGDKLDKDKGRSIDELQAPAFNRNASSDRIRQLAEEKERHREAHLHPGQAGAVGMKGMQYTFAIDPSVRGRATTTKGVTKPSATAPQANKARGRPSRTATLQNLIDGKSNLSDDKNSDPNVLRFPSLFSNDFGPSALLCPLPSVSSSLSYGEDVAMSSADTFGVTRPTFEFPLDELLHSVDSPSSGGAATPGPHDKQATSPVMNTSTNNTKVENGTISLRQAEGFARPHPPTFNPNDLGYPSATPPETSTQSVTKAMRQGPSATPPVRNPGMNPAHINHGNTAPGGVKSECSNCGATHTPLWRRGLNDELNCNACGLYCKLHKRPRPKTLRNSHGDGSRGSGWNAPRNGESEMVADPVQCFNCATMATPLWRKDDEGNTLCNACGLYLKLHGSKRPLSMKSDVIRKRSRHDAEKRGGPGPSNTTSGASPPSGSPSRRTSPTPNDNQQQVPAPHQTVSQSEPLIGPQLPMPFFGGDYEFNQESELMGALGGPPDLSGSMGGINNLSGSPYNGYNNYPSNPSPILGGQGFSSEPQGMMVDIPSADQHRGQKRRRLSDDSGFHSSDTSTLGGTSGLVTPPHLTTSPSSVSVNLTHSPTSPTSFNPFSFYDLAYPTLGIHPPMQVLDGSLFMHPPLVPPFSLPESMGSLGLADASPIEDGDGNRNGPNSGNDHGMMVDSGDIKSEYFLDSHYTSF